ncbi:MAG: hypothetical protein HQL95_02330 [Magnetococcales bacterium]|nr:hypothetical protein [Magnetococcales bacterium]
MILLSSPTITSPIAQVELPDVEQMPASRPIRKRQLVLETDAGIVTTYEVGNATIGVFTMTLYPLSRDDAAAIYRFFSSADETVGVNGRAKTWQLRDSWGARLTVRFAQDVLEPIQRTPRTWQVSITLRQVI